MSAGGENLRIEQWRYAVQLGQTLQIGRQRTEIERTAGGLGCPLPRPARLATADESTVATSLRSIVA